MLTGLRLVSEAADFAARRHTGQQRKGRGSEPYVNHLAEVANLLSIATEGTDAELVAAGWLHDTIEDTATTCEELAQKFGERVAALVVEVTDDMTLAKQERRQEQIVDAQEITRRKTDQNRRQDQQYSRAYLASAEPGGAR
jgi:(p)ppGpp synthase/HD superfamily hydrolase